MRLLRPHGWVLVAAFGLGVAGSVADGFTFSLLIPFLRMLFGAGTPFPDAPTAVERVLAFVLGRDNVSYILRPGTRLFNGEVAEIQPKKVVFRQDVTDPNRRKQYDEVVREITD